MPRDLFAEKGINIDNPRDLFAEKGINPNNSESLFASIGMAPFRVLYDIGNSLAPKIEKIPEYISKFSSEIQGLPNTLKEHPGHFLSQVAAGIPELGQKAFNSPHELVNYTANRLNLFPKNLSAEIQKGKMPDISQDISQIFGNPEYTGESLARGTVRNLESIIPLAKIASLLNPLKYTDKSIIKDVLNTEKQQVVSHNKRYNKIWDEADRTGFNQVPVDVNKLTNYQSVLKKYKTPKEYESLSDFMQNNTLENAQKAQSQMNRIHSALSEKSRKGALDEWENKVYQVAHEAEEHIEDNMFKNSQGYINQPLKDKYDSLTKSYRENVVPYKYNEDIQKFKNKELIKSQLVQRLKKGEFAAKKGSEHPELFRQDLVKNALIGLGIGSAGAAGGAAFNYLKGNK